MNIKGERRYGHLGIPIAHILTHNDPDFYPKMRAIMAEIIVVRAEYMLHDDMLEYDAWSEHFDIVPLGEKIPEYHVIFHDGVVRFSKQD